MLRYDPLHTDGKAPVVVILPIFGGDEYRLECYFGRYFAKHGLALVVRRGKQDIIADEEDVNLMLCRSVHEAVSVLDWIRMQPELDADRIAIFGVSMGGITATLVAAVDQRIKAAVLALVGGDLPYIIRHCQDGALRGGGISAQRADYLKEKQITPDVFEERLRSSITWEPLTLAPRIDPKKILLILAILDRVIPFRKGLQLRRAMGRPEKTVFLISGHYAAMAYLPYVRRAAYRFLKRKLGVSAIL